MRLTRFITLLLATVALAACGSSQGDTPSQASAAHQDTAKTRTENVPTGRLPADVKPLAYTIDFVMNPDKAGFTAHETIKIKLTDSRDTIWFHGQGIDVKNAKLVLANGDRLDIQYKQVKDFGVARLTLPKTVSPQTARIVLDFDNPYSDGLLGAYKVKENGDNYIFTQFEAIAARRAFPSFDEPAFKTPFTYSFTVPKEDKVVANTPVKNKTDAGNGMVKWQFKTTHPLPTYLVAWAIGPFDIVKGPAVPPNDVRDQPVPVNGVTIKGKGKMIQYAVDHAKDIIQAEEQYYGIAYPYYKLSLIAVPDFGAGAMENAGAVTFRSILLLMNPKQAPRSQIRGYWSVAAHEFGHMWTGDLVTLPWWNDIWLNESFATWMEQKVMNKLHPDWHPRMDALNSQQRAMRADSLITARKIRQPINDTGDIKNAFDSGITYAKGAAVLNMFENYVGKEAFRQGMHKYLKENSYGSASLGDFLSAISDAADQDLGPAFKTFLNQPGLPMVEATLKKEDGQPTVHLVQSRYLPVGSSGNREDRHWEIPVCMRYPVDGEATQQCTLLTDHSADIALNTDAMPDWLMPNAKGIGYYQWSLGENGYRQLGQSLDQLTAVGQMSLAGSVEAAFGAAKIHTGKTMRILAPLARSKHQPVAEEPMGLLRFAHDRLVNKHTQPAVEAYARKLYRGYDVTADFQKGGAPDDANQREFEAGVAAFLADTGQDEKVHKAANQAATRVLGLDDNGKMDLDGIAPSFLPVALSVGVRDQGKPVFNAIKEIFDDAPNPRIRRTMLHALVSVTQPKLAQQVRGMIFQKGVLHKNEILTVLFGQVSQPETRDATWSWFKSNYSKLLDIMPKHFSGITALPAVAGVFCSDKKAADVKAFFKGKLKQHPGSKRHLKEGLERAHLCAARREAQSASAEKFFSQ